MKPKKRNAGVFPLQDVLPTKKKKTLNDSRHLPTTDKPAPQCEGSVAGEDFGLEPKGASARRFQVRPNFYHPLLC